MTELTPSNPRRGRVIAILVGALLLVVGGVYLAGVVAPNAMGAWQMHRAPKPRPIVNAAAAPVSPTVAPQLLEKLTPEQAVLINTQTPVTKLPNPPAAPFVLPTISAADRARAQACLAMAVYYEAGNQGVDGEAAVAQVVLNRLRNPYYPKTVCGVVFQGSQLTNGTCQFTFTCTDALNRHPSEDGWRQANEVAARALDGYVQKDVGEATHYHTIWVVPNWQGSVVKVALLGAHVFFRWTATYGPSAFSGQYAGSETAVPLPAILNASPLIGKPPPAIVAKVEESTAQAPPAEIAVAVAPILTQTESPQAAAPTLVTAAASDDLAQARSPTLFGTDPRPIQHLPMR